MKDLRRRGVLAAAVLALALSGLGLGVRGPAEAAGARPAAGFAAAPSRTADPAAQRQNTLDSALGAPRTTTTAKGSVVRIGRGGKIVDPGRTREKPVRTEATSKLPVSGRTKPGDVFRSPTAVNGGCRLEYGTPGQCLPRIPPSQAAHAAHGMTPSDRWTCAEVRTLFPAGVTLRSAGIDPLGLDTDRDGTACGSGDR